MLAVCKMKISKWKASFPNHQVTKLLSVKLLLYIVIIQSFYCLWLWANCSYIDLFLS